LTTMIDQNEVNKGGMECPATRSRYNFLRDIYKDYVLTMLFLKYLSDVWQGQVTMAYKKEFRRLKKMVGVKSHWLPNGTVFVLPIGGADFYFPLYAKTL